jgi:IS30 family transposase
MRIYAHLTLYQRYQISFLKNKGLSQTEIAKELRVHKSTVSRELKRNTGGRGYLPRQAQRKALNRRKDKVSPRIPESTWVLVKKYLKQDWSPEQISGWLIAEKGICISHESIYQYALADKKSGGNLYKHLRCQKKRKKRYGKYDRRSNLLLDRTIIDERPKLVDSKERIGDWEVDTIIGKNHKQAIVSLTERKSYLTLIRKVDTRTAENVTAAIIDMLKPIAGIVHTITSDNGKEFAGHKKIAEELDADFYFAHPYAPWERGINENINGLIRQYVPKKTSFDDVDDTKIQHIMDRLNNRPRKTNGYKTPIQIISKVKTVALRI